MSYARPNPTVFVRELEEPVLGGSVVSDRPTLFWHPVESRLATPGQKRWRKLFGLECREEAMAICRLTNVRFVDCLNCPEFGEGSY